MYPTSRLAVCLFIFCALYRFGFAGEEKEDEIRRDGVMSLTVRAFKRPKAMFNKAKRGKYMLRYYEINQISNNVVPREELSDDEKGRRPEHDPIRQLAYAIKEQSALVYLPADFKMTMSDEELENEAKEGLPAWSAFVHLQSGEKAAMPPAFQGVLNGMRMIYAAPNAAGEGVPDTVRMLLVFDTLATLHEKYPHLDSKRTVILGLGEAGVVAQLMAVSYPEYYADGGVICDKSLIIGSRHTAGRKEERDYYYPVNAPWVDPSQWKRIRKHDVRFAFAFTDKRSIEHLQEHWRDWETIPHVELHPFFIGQKEIAADRLKIMLEFVLGKKTPGDALAPPEDAVRLVTRMFPAWE